MVDKALFSSERHDWETPPDLFAKLDREFGFKLDAAATRTNAKCRLFLDEAADALKLSWSPSPVWLNPPYGRTIGQWVEKARRESERGATVVCLLPARTDTAWFHDHVLDKAKVRFLRGRLRFVGAESSAPFPSMLAIYRPGKTGVCLRNKENAGV